MRKTICCIYEEGLFTNTGLTLIIRRNVDRNEAMTQDAARPMHLHKRAGRR